MTDDTTSAPDSAPESAPAPTPAPAPAGLLAEILADIHKVMAKLETFEHEVAASVKARLETIFNDIKEHL